MAQQIKKKFIDPDLIAQIDAIESGLAQEILDRIASAEALQEQLDFIKSNTDPEALDSLTEIIAAFQAADSDLSNAISDLAAAKDERISLVEADVEALKLASDALLSQIEQVASDLAAAVVEVGENIEAIEDRLDVIESKEYIIEAESVSAFPSVGEASRIYVAKDSNKIYRYAEGEGDGEEIDLPVAPEKPEELTVADADIVLTFDDNLQDAINNAQAGAKICLGTGVYLFTQNLTIDKPLTLYGMPGVSGVFLRDERSNSQTFLNVSADNVTLRNLIIEHSTTDANIGIAVTVSGGGFPQERLKNFRMYDCVVKYSKGALSVRSDDFVLEGNRFQIFAGSGTRRGILHYGNGGDSFIKNNVFANITSAALRAICPTATSGSNPSDDLEGTLTIEGSTFEGNLSQFVNMDNHQGEPDSFALIVKDNVTPETNAFVVSFGGAQHFGDVFKGVVLLNNTLTNNHSSGLGKGAFAIDGLNGLHDYRSTPLEVIAVGNTLGQTDFRSGYAEASGSTGALVGYNITQINQPTVNVSDSLEGGAGGSGEYVELSPTIDQDLGSLETRLDELESRFDQPAFAKVKIVVGSELGYVDLDHIALDESLVVTVGRVAVHLGDDFVTSVVDEKTRLTWIGSLANPDGAEKIEEGDVVYASYAYMF